MTGVCKLYCDYVSYFSKATPAVLASSVKTQKEFVVTLTSTLITSYQTDKKKKTLKRPLTTFGYMLSICGQGHTDPTP